MPVKPHPFTVRCPVCSWKKTVAPKSDALMPGEWFERCPKCRNENLEKSSASIFEELLSHLKNIGKKRH